MRAPCPPKKAVEEKSHITCIEETEEYFCPLASPRSTLKHPFLSSYLVIHVLYHHPAPRYTIRISTNSHGIIGLHALFCIVSFPLLILTLSFTLDCMNALAWPASHPTEDKGLWASEHLGFIFIFIGIHETDLVTFCTHGFLKYIQVILRYSLTPTTIDS